MPTKKIGYIIISIGLIVFVISLLGDYLSFGNGDIGPVQLLGAQIGFVIILVGIGLVRFNWIWKDGPVRLINSLIRRISVMPVIAWVSLSFVGVYFSFFLVPTFLNSDLQFQYFYKYLPDQPNVGLDIRDTMWFIEQWLVFHQSPYETLNIAYPPMLFVLYAPLSLVGYPTNYYILIGASLLLFTASTLCVPLFSAKDKSLPLLLFLFGLFSYGLQFEFERGQSNVIAVSLVILAVYIYHYHHDHRYWSYLLFTLGVQIKIYPVIYAIMFIRDWRDWKGNVRRIAGLLLINFSLLFVMGPTIFFDFLRALGAWGGGRFSRNWNNSLQGFVRNLASDGFWSIQPGVFEKYMGIIELSLFIVFGLCFVAVLVNSFIRNEPRLNPDLLLICTIGALIIPSVSYDYKLPILIAPVSLVLSRLPRPSRGLKGTLSILLILLMSAAYWSTQYPPTSKPVDLSHNVPAHFIMLLAVTALHFLMPWTRDEEL